MIHKMNLHNEPFNKIKLGTKTVELRLYDEKRQKLKINDLIEFTNRITQEKITVKVEDVRIYTNFSELYNNFDKISIGYDKNEIANPDDMLQYYPKEEQEKYGVVAIIINKR